MLATKILSVAIVTIATFIINADAKLFRTNDNLNIREQPSLNAKVLRVAPKGSNVDIVCQTTGDPVDGKNIWDKLADGSFCFDAFVDGAIGLSRCDSSPSSNPPPTNPPPASANNGKINDEGLKLLMDSEGFIANFKGDLGGHSTIGFGHNCDADPNKCKDIHPPITRAQGEEILRNDIIPRENCVKKLTTANIDSNKFSALVSFAFNLGCGLYENSSLRQKLNAGDIKGAANEFALFNKVGNTPVKGLTRRRKAERDLFCKSGGC
ncbi:Glycoside Hydrolase Family 24 protein [Gigaspora rosea]|uniref:Glycoside Hydrolase Family 24 protein n=1 Tax=Gigaspora rosea TaxID=44941 RepID=A0A397VV26_9GLOM|nr:Glycoside Hydrolase Family 24 protein [Gigaspora rosea]